MTIGIIGYGRFGALWATLLEPNHTLRIYDTNKQLVDVPTVETLAELRGADIIFITVPIAAIPGVCTELKQYISPDTIVCDMASVKVFPKTEMQRIFALHQPLVFTHPLFGPDSVKKSGIKNKKFVVCTESQSQASQKIITICKELGIQVITVSTTEHDEQMARSQAIVHLLGRSLAPLQLQLQEIATPDYEQLLSMIDMVKNDTKKLFLDMQRYNPYTKKIRQQIQVELQSLEKEILKEE